MVSKAFGKIRVLAWIDNDQVKPLVTDAGLVPVTLDAQTGRVDVDCYGIDGVTARQIVVDAAGNVKTVFAGQDVNVQVEQGNPGYLRTGVSGWNGTTWKALSLLWGYSDRWAEYQAVVSGGTGTDDVYTVAVPANAVYVLNLADAYSTLAPTSLNIAASYPGLVVTIADKAAPGAGTIVQSGYCSVPLKEGDRVRARFLGLGAGSTCVLRVGGYKMGVGA